MLNLDASLDALVDGVLRLLTEHAARNLRNVLAPVHEKAAPGPRSVRLGTGIPSHEVAPPRIVARSAPKARKQARATSPGYENGTEIRDPQTLLTIAPATKPKTPEMQRAESAPASEVAKTVALRAGEQVARMSNGGLVIRRPRRQV